MKRHIDEELEGLREKLLRMGAAVQKQIQDAVSSLLKRNSDGANAVIEGDHRINAMDVEIDRECLRILALLQPTAGDLRFITTAMKIATDLERMSDLAEDIAERAIELNNEPQLKPYIDLPKMAGKAEEMVRAALDAFVEHDSGKARAVCEEDDGVDQLLEQIFRELLTYMIQDPRAISRGMRLSFVAKYIERIADHATNIAELVIYMVEGEIIRHTSPEPTPSATPSA